MDINIFKINHKMKKLSVLLNQQYRSFDAGFSCNLEGDLIILSGVNGSGKSQLIDIISQRESHGSKKAISANIKLDRRLKTVWTNPATLKLPGKLYHLFILFLKISPNFVIEG